MKDHGILSNWKKYLEAGWGSHALSVAAWKLRHLVSLCN